jgi:hypothetical protein
MYKLIPETLPDAVSEVAICGRPFSDEEDVEGRVPFRS